MAGFELEIGLQKLLNLLPLSNLLSNLSEN